MSVLLVTLLCGLAGGLLGALQPTAPTARADEPTPLVRITMTGFSPSVVEPGKTVRLTGRVTNISGQPLHHLSAYVWRDTTPITTATGLATAAKSASNDPLGTRIADFGTYDELFTASHPDLAPKASVGFTLTTTTSALLGSNPANGVYLMGVHVLLPTSNQAVGRARIYVPVVNPSLSTDNATTVKLSSLVLLDAAPSQLRTGVLADDHLASEVRTGGRLDSLLRSAERPSISYAVDPDLIATLRTMSAGYQVTGADGQLSAGTGRTAATDWLRRFAELQSDHDGFRLPYARYDLPSLVHTGQLAVARAGEAAAAKVADVGTLPLLVAPAGGAADQATLDAARSLGARAVLLDQSRLDGLSVSDASPVVAQPDGMTVLGYDSTSSAGGPGPAPDTTAVHLRQSALAASYIEALGATPGAGSGAAVGQVRVVTDPDQARGDLDPKVAPWLRLADVGDLLTSTPTRWTGRPVYDANDRRAELTSGQVASADDLDHDFDTLHQLLADPAAVAAERDQTLPRLVSDNWRGRPGAQQSFLHELATPFDQLLRGDLVHLEARDLVLTGSAGNVPITVVNDSSLPVRVQVTFISPNRQRLDVQDVPARVIAAGERVPLTAEVRARSSGKLPVRARISTVDGTQIGKELTITINPTQAGRIGWLISLGALVVLVSSTAFRIRQVRRERAKTEPGATPTDPPTDPPTDSTTDPRTDSTGDPAGDPSGVPTSDRTGRPGG